MHKYNYFYKITNKLNNMYYYGIHSTDNLEDGYMGSGKRITADVKRLGKHNFTKEIIKFFDTRELCAEYEKNVVNINLLNDPLCYNIILGGENFNTIGLATVKDKNGNIFDVSVSDPKYKDGTYQSIMVGKVILRNIDTNEYECLPKNSEQIQQGNYVGVTSGYVCVIEKLTGITKLVPINEYKINKSLYKTYSTGKIVCKDSNGNFIQVDKNDDRYLRGELTYIWLGRKHTELSKEKMRKSYLLNKHQEGEKNSLYGTKWVHKDTIAKKIQGSLLDEYIANGWSLGRKDKLNNKKCKIINNYCNEYCPFFVNGMCNKRLSDLILKFNNISKYFDFDYKLLTIKEIISKLENIKLHIQNMVNSGLSKNKICFNITGSYKLGNTLFNIFNI